MWLTCRGNKNGEVQLSQADYQRLLGWRSGQTTSTWMTYTIDWWVPQPLWATRQEPDDLQGACCKALAKQVA